jgi:2-furoate---CoA ligase
MFDLGWTFLAAVERSPDATAIPDGKRRLGYASSYEKIVGIAGGLTAFGLRRGGRLAVILQNRLEMASLHWTCQFAGIVAAHRSAASGLTGDRLVARLPALGY